MKPAWSLFWNEYPDYINFPDSGVVKAGIGGGVNSEMVTNTCAVRMSCGLNNSGVIVPGGHPGLLTLKGADNKHYALRVAELRKWLPLPSILGKPDFDFTKQAGTVFDKSTISGKTGIIAFDISFSDATGHIDAWNGSTFSSEYKVGDYWTRATRITLWVL